MNPPPVQRTNSLLIQGVVSIFNFLIVLLETVAVKE